MRRPLLALGSLYALDGENIPLDDESADAALSTFTMSTIPDVARALNELHRVLRPSGQLHFHEHGLSPDLSVAKWQQRLTPLQRRICGGCHFDRPIDQLPTAAGFEIATKSTTTSRGRRPPVTSISASLERPEPSQTTVIDTLWITRRPIWVPIEHAALGVATAWVAAPVVASRPAAELIDATAGPGQLVALGAAALAALVITNRRSFLDFRET